MLSQWRLESLCQRYFAVTHACHFTLVWDASKCRLCRDKRSSAVCSRLPALESDSYESTIPHTLCYSLLVRQATSLSRASWLIRSRVAATWCCQSIRRLCLATPPCGRKARWRVVMVSTRAPLRCHLSGGPATETATTTTHSSRPGARTCRLRRVGATQPARRWRSGKR